MATIATLAVIAPPSSQRCCRSGECCKNVLLNNSPRTLRRVYRQRYFFKHRLAEAVRRNANRVQITAPLQAAIAREVRDHRWHETAPSPEAALEWLMFHPYRLSGLRGNKVELIGARGEESRPKNWASRADLTPGNIEDDEVWEGILRDYPEPPERDVNDRDDDILAIYPAYANRCRGRIDYEYTWEADGKVTACRETRFVFSCAHLQYDEQGLASCGIYETRPFLCAEYPWGAQYYQSQIVRGIYASLDRPNPGYMAGCGFNQNPNNGHTPAQIEALLRPLTSDEL